SATEQGNGGKIVLWSDQGTNFDGTILARGGPAGGDGGFAEVSSGGQLRFTGGVNLSAPNGTTGTLLLDPSDVIICSGKDCGSRDYNSDGGNFRDGSTSYLDA